MKGLMLRKGQEPAKRVRPAIKGGCWDLSAGMRHDLMRAGVRFPDGQEKANKGDFQMYQLLRNLLPKSDNRPKALHLRLILYQLATTPNLYLTLYAQVPRSYHRVAPFQPLTSDHYNCPFLTQSSLTHWLALRYITPEMVESHLQHLIRHDKTNRWHNLEERLALAIDKHGDAFTATFDPCNVTSTFVGSAAWPEK